MPRKRAEDIALETAVAAARIEVDRLTHAFMTPDDDLASCLRAHLTIEEMFTMAISGYCEKPQGLDSAGLGFMQKFHLARALCDCEALPKSAWDAIEVLYSIRNMAAHRLQPKKAQAAMAKFNKLVHQVWPELRDDVPGSDDVLYVTLPYLIGAVSMFTLINAGVAAIKQHAVSTRNRKAIKTGKGATFRFVGPHPLLMIHQLKKIRGTR